MKKNNSGFIVLVVCLMFSLVHAGRVSAQDVEVISLDKSDGTDQKSAEFAYIDDKFDVSSLNPVAEYKLVIKRYGDSTFAPSFAELRKKALKTTANSFKVKEALLDDDVYTVSVETYDISGEQRKQNLEFYEENIVLVFGSLNMSDVARVVECRINNGRIDIQPFTYMEYQNKNSIEIRVGGLIGGSNAVTVLAKDGKLGSCYVLGQRTVSPISGITETANVNLGISVNKPSVYFVELDFGLFVKNVLDRVKK